MKSATGRMPPVDAPVIAYARQTHARWIVRPYNAVDFRSRRYAGQQSRLERSADIPLLAPRSLLAAERLWPQGFRPHRKFGHPRRYP